MISLTTLLNFLGLIITLLTLFVLYGLFQFLIDPELSTKRKIVIGILGFILFAYSFYLLKLIDKMLFIPTGNAPVDPLIFGKGFHLTLPSPLAVVIPLMYLLLLAFIDSRQGNRQSSRIGRWLWVFIELIGLGLVIYIVVPIGNIFLEWLFSLQFPFLTFLIEVTLYGMIFSSPFLGLTIYLQRKKLDNKRKDNGYGHTN